MKIPLLLLVFLIYSSCSSNNKNNGINSAEYRNLTRDSIFLEARKDLEKDSLKFFYSGIVLSPPQLARYLKENFKITVVNKIDISDINDTYYNEFTDSLLYSQSGKRFSDFYREIK